MSEGRAKSKWDRDIETSNRFKNTREEQPDQASDCPTYLRLKNKRLNQNPEMLDPRHPRWGTMCLMG